MEMEERYSGCDYLREEKYYSCAECYRYDICQAGFEKELSLQRSNMLEEFEELLDKIVNEYSKPESDQILNYMIGRINELIDD